MFFPEQFYILTQIKLHTTTTLIKTYVYIYYPTPTSFNFRKPQYYTYPLPPHLTDRCSNEAMAWPQTCWWIILSAGATVQRCVFFFRPNRDVHKNNKHINMWNQPPPDETNIWTWHQQQTYRYEKTPPKVFISAAIETTWKSRLCFFFKCLGRRSDRRYILYIRWVRFWLFCHLDDWSYHFLKPLEVKNITHELQRPLEGKIGRCIIFGGFGLLFGD